MNVLVRFEPSHRTVEVPAGTSLLEAARQGGLPVASACGAEGLCARCGLTILAGGDEVPPESERERDVKRRNRIDASLRLACYVGVVGDMTVTAPNW